MRVTIAFIFTCTSLVGCVGGGMAPVDMGPLRDTGPVTDTGPSGDTGPRDSGPSATVTMAQLTNKDLAGHPPTNTRVTVTDSLVALSPRLFISQSMTSGKCLFAAWVGTPTGGDFSGIEVTDSYLPPAAADGGAGDCFTAPANKIPDTLNIGDTITALGGQYEDFCLPPAMCPPSTSEELAVDFMGTFTVGAPGTAPTPTTVTVTDVNGTMLTLAPRDMALQGSLVKLTGTVLQDPPTTANHQNMQVSMGTGATPTMFVSVSKYSGVGCQRTALTALGVGGTVGDITGLLQYSFGQWIIQPRQPSDIPGIVCAMDGGVPTDAGAMDAGISPGG